MAEDDELTTAKLHALLIKRYPELTVSVFSQAHVIALVYAELTATATHRYYLCEHIGMHPTISTHLQSMSPSPAGAT